ncbi:unnamed protein product [Pieris brassicae]|uniref:Uncharacterized protein n=1 Tax=Pieris brassicae TaxID=7116 RepID=A0A9P0XBE8_PIEBR|nr:unnamed protein product [Pieris brassicae]
MLQFTRDIVRRNVFNANILKCQSSTSLAKLKKLQADFQREDGTLIWLKRGFSDRVLYTSTVVGCYLGVIMCLAVFYDNAKPESWKKKD